MSSFNLHAIRNDFPILQTNVYGVPLIYLDNAATTQKPSTVIDQVVSFYSTSNSNVHRSSYYLGEKASNLYESSRECVRRFIGAQKSSEVIFTSGTTASINLVAQSLGDILVKAGDEIIITAMEHHSNILPWQLLCQRKGATLKVISTNNQGELLVDSLQYLITDKTRILAITHISNVTGIINPLKEIISLAHSFHIPVLVDGAQSAAHQHINVFELDCDFFAFSGHKLYAETGIGVLYGKEKWLERMPPCQGGGGMISSVQFEKTSYAELPFKFEAGTQNIAGAVSLGAAINYLEHLGKDNIFQHEQKLISYAEKRLSSLDKLIIYSLNVPKSSILSFNIKDTSSFDVCTILDRMGVAVRCGTHCAQPFMHQLGVNGTTRASFALYNTFNEIDILFESLKRTLQAF